MAETVLPLSAAALALVGLAALGRLASASVCQQERYFGTFGQVRCQPPPGLDRREFLREVQYEADLPDRLDLCDKGLSSRLRNAFAQHAWVEEVERIELRPGQPVRVRLRHCTPVLVVSVGEEVRVVDRHGVLLPHAADAAGLPALRGKVRRGSGPTGTVCAESAVLAAARTVGFLLPQQERLQLAELEYRQGQVILWTAGGSRICWGSPPGEEGAGEASAVLKRDRLLLNLDQRAEAGQAERTYEQDLRPAAGAACRPLCQGVQVGARGEP
jgi:PAS domain-containing protein